jgi:hypothetical protein
MGCAASAQGATLQRDLNEAWEKINALEAELQAARASTGRGAPPYVAVYEGVPATSAIVPVSAAFEAARNAPDAVRISGAAIADGTPDFVVNGIFQKKSDMRNGRVLYAKIGSQDRVGLWCDEDGLWCVGEMESAGSSSSDCRASTLSGTQAPSPDRAAVVWKMRLEGKSYKQEKIKVEAVTEDVVAAETRRRESQEATEHAEASAFVRISGATVAGGNLNPYVNGDYAKTADICNGRATYEKLGDTSVKVKTGLWCDIYGKWCLGDMVDVVRRP